ASLHKGDVVMVLGKLKVDQWESGDKRGTSIKIRADHIGHSLRLGPSLRQRAARPTAESEATDDPSGPDSAEDVAAMWAESAGAADAFAHAGVGPQTESRPDAAWAPPGVAQFGP